MKQKDEKQQVPALEMPPVEEPTTEVRLARHPKAAKAGTNNKKITDAPAGFTGGMIYINIHLLLSGGWIAWHPGQQGFRPLRLSLVALAMAAMIQALFLFALVLIRQNHMAAQAGKSANLQLRLQIKQELTCLLTCWKAFCLKSNNSRAPDPGLPEPGKDLYPGKLPHTRSSINNRKNRFCFF